MAHSSIRRQHLFLLLKINRPLRQKTFYWLTSFVRFGIGRFTSEDEVWNSHLPFFFYFIIFATLHRWGTLWRGLWRRSTDWERCLPSGTWFRLTHQSPSFFIKFMYSCFYHQCYSSSGRDWSEDNPMDPTLIAKNSPPWIIILQPWLVSYCFVHSATI